MSSEPQKADGSGSAGRIVLLGVGAIAAFILVKWLLGWIFGIALLVGLVGVIIFVVKMFKK